MIDLYSIKLVKTHFLTYLVKESFLVKNFTKHTSAQIRIRSGPKKFLFKSVSGIRILFLPHEWNMSKG